MQHNSDSHTNPNQKQQSQLSQHPPLPQSQQQLQQSLSKTIQKLAQQHLNLSPTQIHTLLSQPQVDRLLGCMFGAFIADSLGSYCQFTGRQQAHKLIKKTMTMPGGGTFSIHAGQVTDDSEMALHMLSGLLAYNQKLQLKEQIQNILLAIAQEYIRWLDSIPFDIGFTCRSSIGTLENYLGVEGNNKHGHKAQLVQKEQGKTKENKIQQNKKQKQQQKFTKLKQAWLRIAQINQSSLSNGFLMRITPMACFYTLMRNYKPNQPIQSLKQLIFGQNNMTHSNKLCLQSAYQYIQLIHKLINRQSHQDILTLQHKYKQQFNDKSGKSTISCFIYQAFNNNDKIIGAIQHSGYFKIAYHYTFYYFKYIAQKCKNIEDLNAELYKKIISQVISEGGDTDTNACIVGGMLGSIIGFKNLPVQYLDKQLKLVLGGNQGHRGQKERFYQPSKGFVNLIKLILKFKRRQRRKQQSKQ